MILSKDFMVKANFISKCDADFRYEEFKKFKNLNPEYKNYPAITMKSIWENGTFFTINSVEGIYGEMNGKFLIIFRGSDGLLDWIFNFLISKKVIPYKETGTNKKIKIHYGFYKSYMEVRDFIHKIIKETNLTEIVFHGHSRGAVLAALAALDIQYNFIDKKISSFVVGMPKLGNNSFKISFEKRITDFIRIENGSDIFTQIPPYFLGYTDIGNLIHIGAPRKKGIGNFKDHNHVLYFESMIKDL